MEADQFETSAITRRIAKQQQMQQQARTKVKQQKLRLTFMGYVIVLIFLAIVQIIGVAFFSMGFLLTRNVLPDIADCNINDSCIPPKFDKAVLLVIDALRFDFAIPIEGSNEYYHNNFPILNQLAQKDNAVLLKFMADPPTTTLQRLKGLTTGSLPTFIDAGSNFDGDHIDEDNWVLQLHKQNKSIACLGDDTWQALFSNYINPDLSFPFDSLNVWDLHTVDNGVIKHIFPLLDKSQRNQWDVLIGHFLGVDHAGHRYGPTHYAMKEKLNQMNELLIKIIAELEDNTLLIVMGDHGMDHTGNHGGDSLDELESTLFMYSKNKKFNKKDKSHYDISDKGKNYRWVNQIDIVPTISLLLGLPIPFNNLGYPIDEVFSNDLELAQAAHKSVQQLHSFRIKTPDLSSKLNEDYLSFIQNYTDHGKDKTRHQDLVEQAKRYQFTSLEECKSLWATFDMKLIYIGLTILFLSLTFLLTYARSIPSVRVSTMSFEFIGSVIAMCLLGLVISLSIYIVLKPVDFSLNKCLATGAAAGIIIGFWAPVMDRFSLNWLWHQTIDFFLYNFNSYSFAGLLFVFSHCVIFASNSFVVWEDKMISFFLISFGFCCLYGVSIKTGLPKEQKILGLMHALTFILLTRLTSMIDLCREEQRPYCVPTFISSWWSILLLHGSTYILPAMIMSFYNLSGSYHSAAPLWIGTGLKFLMFMNAAHWSIEYIQNSDYFNANNIYISTALLKSLNLAIARIVLFVGLILANYSWSKGPLCVKLEFSQNEADINTEENEEVDVPKTANILGYGNVYGSSYFLLLLNFAVAIMLVTKPLGAISLNMLIIQILSLLELYDLLNIRKNLVAPIIFGLLAYQHFFSTGHQATLAAIQWEIGFMTTETIVFPFTHLNIILNTFGSFFIVCLAIPLITLWKIVPSNKPITVLSQIITNITTLLTYIAITGLSSLIFAAHFRRHLMVWKIFAPRFMLSGLLIILLNIFIIIVPLAFGTGKVVTQVNRIFGK
ncbi:hypothetical protein DFJ63DRAFT_194102 [Scheffersomyces coipomensis]|uniref:uncharacterized protein n=1 Tax=Scheffersomyces coipomensis TaxID=1788519 RepID=UPI00315CA25E